MYLSPQAWQVTLGAFLSFWGGWMGRFCKMPRHGLELIRWNLAFNLFKRVYIQWDFHLTNDDFKYVPFNLNKSEKVIPVSILLSNISMFFLPLNPSNVLGQGKEVCEKSECSQVVPFFPSNGLCMSCVGHLFLLFPIPLSMGNLSVMSANGVSQIISTVSV